MARVFHAELWGEREGQDGQGGKYGWLGEQDIKTTHWKELEPQKPYYLFVPQDTGLKAEYEKSWKLTDIFPLNGVGMTTARDHVVIDFEKELLLQRARTFRDSPLSDEEVCRQLAIPLKKGWNVKNARKLIRAEKDLDQFITRVLYRPFDTRWIFYHDSLVWRTVKQVMRHMLAGENLALLVTRQTRDQWDVFVSRSIIAHKSCSGYDITSLVPLFVRAEGNSLSKENEANFSNAFVAAVTEKNKTLGQHSPEDVLNYIYAIFHCPTYRSRYAEFLKTDFPRVPLTSDRELFRALCEKGGELVALHLIESPLLDKVITRFPVPGDHLVAKGYPKYAAQGRVHINADQYFEGVPEEVWAFHIGGYQVAQKWLKDRQGRQLSYDDLTHYQKTITALHHTIRIMKEIDALIPKWPME